MENRIEYDKVYVRYIPKNMDAGTLHESLGIPEIKKIFVNEDSRGTTTTAIASVDKGRGDVVIALINTCELFNDSGETIHLRASRYIAKAVNLFVGNIPFWAVNENLRVFFESRGIQVGDIRVPRDEEGRSRGFAFVTVAGDDLAKSLTLDRAKYGNEERGFRELNVRKAEPRGPKQKQGRREEVAV